MVERYRSIVVIDLLGGLGDLILVLPAIHALAESHPGAELHVLTHAPGGELLATDPAVASVRTAPRGQERVAVADTLTGLRPELVVSTTRHSGIPELVASTGCRAVTDLWRHPPADQRIDLRYLEILRAERVIAPGTPTESTLHITADERERAGAALGLGVPVVLVPRAGMAVKEWPTANWAALAGRLALAGSPVLTAAEHPPELAGAVPLPPGSLRDLAARFAEVGRRGGVVVGGDTGPLRVADAVGARTVGLFGPTARSRYGLTAADIQGLPGCPYRRPLAITEQPCWWHAECPLSATGPACMADIDVAGVATAVLSLLR
jgi:ADP-heptose:LPS heptosyltransferase